MSEPLADHDDVDAGGEHERGLAVAQVVQSDASKADLLGEFLEAVREPVGLQWYAVGPGEHEVVVVVGVAERGAGGVLAQAVGEQHADGVRVEVDDAVLSAGGFGSPECDAPVVAAALGARAGEAGGEGDDLLADVDPVAFEVDIGPAQSGRFAAAQAGGCQELERRPEGVVVGVVEEPAELLGLPRAHVLAGHGGQVDAGGRVRGDQARLHRRAHCRAERGVHAAQGGRLHLAVGLDGAQGGLDVVRAQVAQAHVPDAWDEVLMHVRGVRRRGGGPDAVGDLAGQPVEQELPDGDAVDRDAHAAGAGVDHFCERLLRVLLGREPEPGELTARDVLAVRVGSRPEVDGIAPRPMLLGAGLAPAA